MRCIRGPPVMQHHLPGVAGGHAALEGLCQPPNSCSRVRLGQKGFRSPRRETEASHMLSWRKSWNVVWNQSFFQYCYLIFWSNMLLKRWKNTRCYAAIQIFQSLLLGPHFSKVHIQTPIFSWKLTISYSPVILCLQLSCHRYSVYKALPSTQVQNVSCFVENYPPFE